MQKRKLCRTWEEVERLNSGNRNIEHIQKHRVDVHERSRHSCYILKNKYSIHPSTITKGLYIYIYQFYTGFFSLGLLGALQIWHWTCLQMLWNKATWVFQEVRIKWLGSTGYLWGILGWNVSSGIYIYILGYIGVKCIQPTGNWDILRVK